MKKFALSLIMVLVAVLAMPNMVSAATANGWQVVVSAMKNDEMLQTLRDSGNTVTVTSDDSKMVIQMSSDEITTPYTVTYNYAQDIVYYNSVNTANDPGFAFFESIVNAQFLKHVVDYYGYSWEDFSKWSESVDPTTLTLSEDGIEITEYVASATDENGSTTVSGIKSMKVNIECGISGYTPTTTPETPEVTPDPEPTPEVTPDPEPTPEPEEIVDNPDTGLYVSLGVIAVAVAGMVAFVCSKKKSYFSKI